MAFKLKTYTYLLQQQNVISLWQLQLPYLPLEVETFLLSLQGEKVLLG